MSHVCRRLLTYSSAAPSASLFRSALFKMTYRRMMTEEVCVRMAALSTQEAPPDYEMAFSENNPSLTWKDRTSDPGQLKEVFAKFDSSAPISTEILSRARFLCAKYLGGAWTRVAIKDFRLKAITGGMSNLLFLVELPTSLLTQGAEPRSALLRVHCQQDLDQLLSESVVFTLLSERNLGPRLLGVFPGGRFEQYIPSRPLLCEEISQPRFARLIAPMLARVHTLDVPVTKEPEVLTCARGWLEKFRRTAGGQQPIQIYCTEASVDPSEYPAMITCDDLEKELDFVENFLRKSGSPVVFSHNDLQEGNLLLLDGYDVKEDGTIYNEAGPSEVKEPLTLIDFEYCNYNYRGFDLGNHFCEYGYDYNCEQAPYYKIHQDRFGVVDERKVFCEAYLEEVYRMRDLGENPHFPSDLVSGDRVADLKKLIEESVLFMPVSNIFWTCWALLNAEHAVIAFDYASYGRDRLALYYKQKPQLESFLRKL